MSKIVTIYNPKGEPVKATRANAVDLTRHSGFTWQKNVSFPVNAPIPSDISEKDNAPDLSKNSESGLSQVPARALLEEEAVNLGVEFSDDTSDADLKTKIDERKADLANVTNSIDGVAKKEDDEDETTSEEEENDEDEDE